MKKIAVVIVNYKVKYNIHLCLYSLEKAIKNIDAEIFVVDNNSGDGSKEYLTKHFPYIKFIQNSENVGFSRANNVAIKQANAEYILLLNPDTFVAEDTITKCLDFMDSHPEAGAVGVPIIDGDGNLLPESKRGIPTPWVGFTKLTGLHKLFPKSKLFAKYYLSYQDPDKINEIEVLTGAFFFTRKKVLDEIGLLDETFFMYGEDIDLSYRVLKAGYKIYYIPDTEIVHFKGEATDKNSLQYVKIFHEAMEIFIDKHFPDSGKTYKHLLKLGVRANLAISAMKRIINKILIPATDFAILSIPAIFIKNTLIIIPAIVLVLNFGLKTYRKPFTLKNLLISVAIMLLTFAGIFIYNFSLFSTNKIITILTILLYPLVGILVRGLYNYKEFRFFFPKFKLTRKIAILSGYDEGKRIQQLYIDTNSLASPKNIVGIIVPEGSTEKNDDVLGTEKDLKKILKKHLITELVFGLKDLSLKKVIKLMKELKRFHLVYRFVVPGADFIIGKKVLYKKQK